jgi:putative Mn2+ efflux pump MntP
MSLWAMVLLGMALGVDAFSACLGIGFGGISRRRALCLVGSVAAFHVLMPLAGWWLGQTVGALLGRVAGVVGAALLFIIGARMIYAAVRTSIPGTACFLLPGSWGLLCFSASVSVDALSVGFALGVHRFGLLLIILTIGLVAGFMAALGLGLGRTVGAWVGYRAQFIGGVILLYVGLRLLS